MRSRIACVLLLGLLTSLAGGDPTPAGSPPAVTPPPPTVLGDDGAPMVLVPAGPFTMGSDDGPPDERPSHKVTLDAFYIDRCEVTNRLFRQFVKATGRRPSPFEATAGLSGDDQPVVGITLDEAAAYCRWAGKRLPTEAEWEKAARGTDARIYPWGNEPPGRSLRGNFADAALLVATPDARAIKGYDDRSGLTAPVGSFPAGASPCGALDMAGNVFEWCSDYYSPGFYKESPEANPTGPESGTSIVVRGGSFRNVDLNLRCATRSRLEPSTRLDRVGFRCVKPVR